MGGTKTITELLLLNFLLILTPIYFYQFIITNYSAWKSRVSLGMICGAASILCMIFPIVSGTGFLWDLRWIALMMSILYGGVLAGSITALMLVAFRFSLGGLLGSVNVLIVALILLFSLLYLKKSYQGLALTGKIIQGIYFSIYSYAVVVSAIAVHFWIVGNMSFFFQYGLNVFLLMFVSYIFATSLFIYFSENIRDYSRVKEHVSQAEKGNLVSELSTLFSIDMSQTLEKAHTALNDATSQGDWVRTNHLVPIQKKLQKAQAKLSRYVQYTKETSTLKEAVSVKESIEEVLSLMEGYSKQKQLNFKKEIQSDLTLFIEPIKLKQILLNILKNAADATPHGGTISLAAYLKEHSIVIEINDTGIGLSTAQLHSIMEFDSTKMNKTIGRGLTVTFHLLSSISGSIVYESEVDKGTNVRIRIPIK